MKKRKKLFVEGAIAPETIARSIANHESKTNIGAHAIFLGQVRADEIESKVVSAIDYSCYEDMAEDVYFQIREEAFEKFDLNCAHVYHSLGNVEVGKLCFFVFTSSKRRKSAMQACDFFVEEIKKRVPIFGKEMFAEEGYQWKVNS